MRRPAAGFTLLELVIAITLLAAMMGLLYSGVAFALRSWDASAAKGHGAADDRLAENFLRRELSAVFPMRWKDPLETKLAFAGEKDRLRFVSHRPAGPTASGLSLVGLAVERSETGEGKALVMRRAAPDDEAKDFKPLDEGLRTELFTGVESVEFGYFGAESDVADPKWSDAWAYPARMPSLVRARVKLSDGTALPELVTVVRLSEEAGCFENSFQRLCRPRRP